MSKTVIHRTETRGLADYGWLVSYHTFSFSSYHNPERMHFGALRVLNDDMVEEGKGFGTHPHDNMEIISIPLEGELEHQDNMGHVSIIRHGDIQVMSAGTGITHSEFNKNTDRKVKFLQIWVIPNQRNVNPRYDQTSLNLNDRHNKLQQILSPNPDNEGVWIHQNAWFHLGKFDANISTDYTLKNKNNGVYAFIIQGRFTLNGIKLNTRDGLGIWETDTLNIQSTEPHSEILLMEVPMTF